MVSGAFRCKLNSFVSLKSFDGSKAKCETRRRFSKIKLRQFVFAPPAQKGKGRDIETEEMLEELHAKVRELERQNNQLKEKVCACVIQFSQGIAGPM